MNYSIPLFDLNYNNEEEQAVLKTLQSRWISTGPRCEEFEQKFADAFNVKFGLTTANCTVALHLALDVLGIKEGDEVIVPSLTFAATANCVIYAGAKPIFADITSLEDLTISPSEIQKKISPKTKAIIVMHYAGFPCDMDAIMDIARKNNLYVIEDACHAPLSEYNGTKLGSIGDIACYSFFSNKNLSTGEGGMLITNNDKFYNKAKLLRSHGMTTMSYQRAKGHATKYDINSIGYNYRMDDIRASIGIIQLQKLREDLKKREVVREHYLRLLDGNDKVVVPFKKNQDFVSNYIMPIVLKESTIERRDEIRSLLHERGIQTSNHYPAVHLFSCYKDEGSNLLTTEYVSSNEITLPMYSSLKLDEVEYIVDSINDII